VAKHRLGAAHNVLGLHVSALLHEALDRVLMVVVRRAVQRSAPLRTSRGRQLEDRQSGVVAKHASVAARRRVLACVSIGDGGIKRGESKAGNSSASASAALKAGTGKGRLDQAPLSLSR
jgi:hypothetical protein